MSFRNWLSRQLDYPFSPPAVMQISLTFRCNLSCRMCSLVNSLPETQELSTKQVMHAIDQASVCGIKEVLFTGGEPFLRKDLFDLCAYAAGKGRRSIVTTNGTVPLEPIADRLLHSGIGHIHVSLDGLEATHDFFRGNGVFARASAFLNGLNGLRSGTRAFSLGVACTVMDRNVGELAELFRYADMLGVDVINFQPLVRDNGRFGLSGKHPHWIPPQGISLLKEQIRLIRAYRPRHVQLLEEPELELFPKYYAGLLRPGDWRCFGGFKTVFICFSENRPLVYSCHGICGDLDRKTLKQAWFSREAHALRRKSRCCSTPCLQSCYSDVRSQSIGRVVREALANRKKQGGKT